MIEEMAKDICKNINTKMCADGTCPRTWNCPYSNTMAKILVKKGYRKIPESSVVFTEEELERLRKDKVKEVVNLVFWKICERHQYNLDFETNADELREVLDEIKEQFGVEVEE